jgi:hypothetical protein
LSTLSGEMYLQPYFFSRTLRITQTTSWKSSFVEYSHPIR